MRIILVDDMKNISSLKGYPELMTRYIKVVFWRVGEMCSIVEYWLGLFFLYKYRLQIVYYLILNICFSCKILTLAEKICKKNYPEKIQKRCKNDAKMTQKRSKNDSKTIQKRSKNESKTIQKRSKNDPKTIQKRSKNDAKMTQKRCKKEHIVTIVFPMFITNIRIQISL